MKRKKERKKSRKGSHLMSHRRPLLRGVAVVMAGLFVEIAEVIHIIYLKEH